jgi:hypothetical protein
MIDQPKLDERYSVRLEYCGYATPRWVARFCGDWIGQAETEEGAHALAAQFAKRLTAKLDSMSNPPKRKS